MSLTQALSTAISGLQATQQGLSIVAGNVANAQTPGYVRKVVVTSSTAANGGGIGVQVAAVQRVLDQYVQSQLRVETSGASYADLTASFYQQLQGIYGDPGSDSTLETAFNNFTSSLQALSTSPDDAPTQTAVVSSAQVLTQTLNSMSDGIQALRSQAELGLSNSVTTANNAMQQIAQLNQRLVSSTANDSATAALEDQRDSYVDQLSQLMDIKVVQGDGNQISVFTNSGIQLVGAQAAQLQFNAQGTVNAQTTWSADPSKSMLGTITLVSANGSPTDLIASNSIRSGQIAAYLQMRDDTLVQAQSQLDQVAAAMSSALSDKTTAGTAVNPVPQSGFDIDIGGMLAGNTLNVSYTSTGTGLTHNISFVRVDDPSVLPLPNTATADPNDKVIGIDFSSGFASVVSQISNALSGAGISVSNPSGTMLELLDDGAGNTVDVNSASTTTTVTSLQGGSGQLPFFVDGSSAYTGAISSVGVQSTGLAGRIAVNAALIADPSALVKYQSNTDAGDATRPNFILNQLTNASLTYSPNAGIGTTSSPFSGSLGSYLQQMLSLQGQAADSANNLKQGQDVVLSSLQQRFSDSSSVNIDQEMTNLLNLQTAYSANARVMSTLKQMMDSLLNIM